MSGVENLLFYNQKDFSDAQGTIVKEVTSDSFGKILSDSNPNLHVNLGFAGRLYDQDTKPKLSITKTSPHATLTEKYSQQ